MLKINTDIFFVLFKLQLPPCMCEKEMFCSNYVGDHEYHNENNYKIFASLDTVAIEVQNISLKNIRG